MNSHRKLISRSRGVAAWLCKCIVAAAVSARCSHRSRHHHSCCQRQMSGPLRLKLNCIVLGDNPRRIFPVDIERTEIVGDLKEVIKDKKRPEFDHIATDHLELWKVS